MKVVRYSDAGYPAFVKSLDRRAGPSPEIRDQVAEILEEVRNGGDAMVFTLNERFGGGSGSSAAQLWVGEEELDAAVEGLSENERKALNASRKNVREFARRSRRKNWTSRNRQGARVGERFEAFQRVGIYVPGGTAPLVSTALMTVTLAASVGVEEIVVATPPGPEGEVHPALLAALRMAGATAVYRAGGAQAIAAMAFGTESMAPVQKVFGPGNAYVVEAKRQVFGWVGVDLLPGPSEVAVVADETANPAMVAADLLAQAEHGKGSRMILFTPHQPLLEQVVDEIQRQLTKLSRSEHLEEVLAHGAHLVMVPDLDEALELVNAFSPEHLSLVTRNNEKWAGKARTAGALFLGPWSPVAVGDFLAGPSHELPTGGAGKSFAGLTVDQFQHRVSVVEYDKSALKKSVATVREFGRLEGLDAHARSVEIRFE